MLLPAMRKTYEPPNAHASNGAVVQAACTEMLYKIFERCPDGVAVGRETL